MIDTTKPFLLAAPSALETLEAVLGVEANAWPEDRNLTRLIELLRDVGDRDVAVIEMGVPHDPDGQAVWLATELTRLRYQRQRARRAGYARVVLVGFTAGCGITSTVYGEPRVDWGSRVRRA